MIYYINNALNNESSKKRFVVHDDFYENPDYVRDFALQQEFIKHPEAHKGARTDDRFFSKNMKEKFEEILGMKILRFYDNEAYCNGVFQYCTAEDDIVYHCDGQDWAGAIYLTPDAPYDTGTSFYASKNNKERHASEVDWNGNHPFVGGHYDSTKFDLVDTVGNVYNRLVLWDARLIHAATKYFGQNKNDSRLFHLFFFDIEK